MTIRWTPVQCIPSPTGFVDAIAQDLGQSLVQMVGNAAMTHRIDPSRYIRDNVGLPTLTDIIEELARPGRESTPGI